ncbi:MAG: ribonuclease H-like domain-containing protein [Lachnospiraceae bacterium]
MIHKKQKLSSCQTVQIYRFREFLPDIDRILFFDIETTGLGRRNSSLYLIGCINREEQTWYRQQWFAETPAEEKTILCQFIQTAQNYSCFLHFNGCSFDVPYLQYKCTHYKLENIFSDKKQIDLYQIFSPLRPLLPVPSFKQKDLEVYLQTERRDPYTGKDLITLYKKYVASPTPQILETLLLHNLEDIHGLLSLLSFYAMLDLLQGNISQCEASLIPSAAEENTKELLIRAVTRYPFPVQFSLRQDREYLTWNEDRLSLKVSLKDGYLRFYYPNYKDYYYLPEEDYAVHKSLGTYVDKAHRINATKDTCYQPVPWNESLFQETESCTQYVSYFLQHLQ